MMTDERRDGVGSNDLVAMMQEFGIEVRMLGTEEEPSPNGLALGAMLTEIHRLRNLITPPGDGDHGAFLPGINDDGMVSTQRVIRRGKPFVVAEDFDLEPSPAPDEAASERVGTIQTGIFVNPHWTGSFEDAQHLAEQIALGLAASADRAVVVTDAMARAARKRLIERTGYKVANSDMRIVIEAALRAAERGEGE